MQSEETIIVEISFLGLGKKGMGTHSFTIPLEDDGTEWGKATWDAAQAAAKEALTDTAIEYLTYLNMKRRTQEP